VSHVGIVVRDLDETIRQYVNVMGFPTPEVTEYLLDVPDGQKTAVLVTNMYLPNFHVELVEPVSDVGPYYAHLEQYGMSIQHIGLSVGGDVGAIRTSLEAQGGRWSLGAQDGFFAYVDFQSTLGTSFEIIGSARAGSAGAEPAERPTSAALPPLASFMVTHVGFAVTDVEQVMNGFADSFGIATPNVIDYRDSQYPPDSKWNAAAHLRLASWRQGDIGLELIESVGGPTPWSDYVEQQQGSAAQHIAINVGDKMDELIHDLRMKGGTWTNGKPGGNYAYLDFMDTLGIIFELNGTSKMAAGNR
jgi:catechol 2,3-dioxygenase-like lactoylglutathione lyase family enzyme